MGRNTAIYREKKYTCGEYLDVYVYPVYRRPGTRGRKAQPTSAVQQRLNQRHAEEKLTRLLHANFTDQDIALHLTYADSPEDDEQVKRELRNFLRRVKYRRDKLGLPEIRYVAVTERSGTGRVHHHIVMSGDMDRDEVEKLWNLGYANSRRLQFNEQGLTALGKYISKDGIGESRVFYKRWSASKNLIDPPPEISDSRVRSRRRAEAMAQQERELWERLYPGYALSDVSRFHSDEAAGVYLFARLYRKDGTFLKPKQRRQHHERK